MVGKITSMLTYGCVTAALMIGQHTRRGSHLTHTRLCRQGAATRQQMREVLQIGLVIGGAILALAILVIVLAVASAIAVNIYDCMTGVRCA